MSKYNKIGCIMHSLVGYNLDIEDLIELRSEIDTLIENVKFKSMDFDVHSPKEETK